MGMNNDDNIAICTELHIDMDLKPLLSKEGVTLEEIRYYHHWRRGFGKTDIGRFFKIGEEEIEPCINHIQKLLSPESLARDIELRNEIIAIPIRSQERQQQLDESLSKSANSYMKSGINPASVLKEFRDSIDATPSDLIPNLQKQDGNRSFAAEADDNADEQERQLIAALRHEPAKTAKMGKHASYKPTGMASTGIDIQSNPSNQPDKGQSSRNPIPAENGKNTGKRITVRVDKDLHSRIMETAQAIGVDHSSLIRELLERGLNRGSDTKTNAANLAILPEVFQLSPPFRAFCGDLRLEFRKQFLTLLALGHESSQRWPKTQWVKQLFWGLLPLQKHLKDPHVRQD